jgi:predicted dinucleotide-binding enzyme
MATLGLIGSGQIGGTLARLAVDAGLDVVLSNSRAPQTLSDLVDELGPQARAATPAQAAAAGDWVVVTIPVGPIGTTVSAISSGIRRLQQLFDGDRQ